MENLFEVLEKKSYISEPADVESTPTQDEKNGTTTPVTTELAEDVTSQIPDTVPSSTDQPLVSSTSKLELKKDEVSTVVVYLKVKLLFLLVCPFEKAGCTGL